MVRVFVVVNVWCVNEHRWCVASGVWDVVCGVWCVAYKVKR